MSERRRIAWQHSVRTRLLLIALIPMLIVMPIFGGVVVYNWSARFDNLLIAKVNGELTIAHQYLAGLRERSFEQVAALGASAAYFRASENGTLPALLEKERAKYGFDFLYFINSEGQFIAADSHSAPDDPTYWPIVQSALSGQGGTEIDIFSGSQLAEITPDLTAKANISLVSTVAALPTTRTDETRGMIVHSAAPLPFGDGALIAGVLLNQNLDFIDTINDLVYPEASLTEGSQGTTTLFLEDVRISTNVRLFENVRALGTRVSVEVRSAVLDEGRTWLDRAFVVNDWYISAYEPLTDSFGDRIGMLYVGFLDSPYRAAKTRTLLIISAGFLILLLLSIPLFLRLARGVFQPLERIVQTIAKVEAGDLSARTGQSNAKNEVSLVSTQLDTLLEQVQDRDQKLRDWGEELESRVKSRTSALNESNQRLEATTKQLIISEKLAAIGEITASVAHEINNPVAVIQGNIDVIFEELGASATDLKTEFSLIYEQVHRINTLVSKLLQFARPEEYAGNLELNSPNDIINDTLPLVNHLINKAKIDLELDLNADCTAPINRTELQQILINLIVNAIQAMPNGGSLTLTSDNHVEDGETGVLITISDSGVGMPTHIMERVFDPFFTTKKAEGTGLGLSITQKLVTRSGGKIRVESELGHGTRFFLFLPSV